MKMRMKKSGAWERARVWMKVKMQVVADKYAHEKKIRGMGTCQGVDDSEKANVVSE